MRYILKTTIGVASCICLVVAMAAAEKMYVSDDLRITFRTGPGNDRKIISILKSGDGVEVIGTEGDWSQVRLASGKDGWVLTRYLSDEAPCDMILERLQNEFDELNTRAASLAQENQRLTSENATLDGESKQRLNDLNRIQQQYETLKEESSEYLALKADYEKTAARLAKEKQRAEALDEELAQTLRRQHIRWFLSGAGVMVLGIIIGLLTRREKRRSSLL